jgi:hypothetical protein
MNSIRKDFDSICKKTLIELCCKARQKYWEKDPTKIFEIDGNKYWKNGDKGRKKIEQDELQCQKSKKKIESSVEKSTDCEPKQAPLPKRNLSSICIKKRTNKRSDADDSAGLTQALMPSQLTVCGQFYTNNCNQNAHYNPHAYYIQNYNSHLYNMNFASSNPYGLKPNDSDEETDSE